MPQAEEGAQVQSDKPPELLRDDFCGLRWPIVLPLGSGIAMGLKYMLRPLGTMGWQRQVNHMIQGILQGCRGNWPGLDVVQGAEQGLHDAAEWPRQYPLHFPAA